MKTQNSGLAKNETFNGGEGIECGVAEEEQNGRAQFESRKKRDKAQASPSEASFHRNLDLYVGLVVEARYMKGQGWFKATVAKLHPNGYVDLHYDDGDSEDYVKPKYVRLFQ